MSFKEKLTTRAVPTVLLSTVGVLGISGCSNSDWSEYRECPENWSYGQEALSNPSKSYEELQAAVSNLRAMVIEKAGVRNDGQTYSGSAGEELDSVVPNVFDKGYGYGWKMGSDTLVDAPVESICYTGRGDSRKYYFTPQVRAAIGSMKTVGIQVENN